MTLAPLRKMKTGRIARISKQLNRFSFYSKPINVTINPKNCKYHGVQYESNFTNIYISSIYYCSG